MAKITPLSLYVINRIKIRRLVLGYSAERLSILVKRSHGYVLTAENIKLKSQYPMPELPILAQELKWQVHDLLPPDNMDQTSSGKLVDKAVISLDNEADVKLVLDGLIEFGYFKKAKTLAETAKHLYIDDKKQTDILEKVVKKVIKDGKLKREGEGIMEDVQK